MRLSLEIALRFLKSGKNQTMLIILGITVGVAVQIFLGALIDGLQIDLINTTIGSSSHITITSENDEKIIKDYERAIYETKISNKDIINISPALDGPALVAYDDETASILIRGFILEDANNIYKFNTNLYEGVLPYNTNEVIIGKELAIKSNKRIGDRIRITTASGDLFQLKITGLFDLGTSTLNDTWVVTNLETAENLLSIVGINSIEMQVKEVFSAVDISEQVDYALSEEDLKVENWQDLNVSLLTGLNAQSISSYMIQGFVLVAVLLGISSVLAVSVVQRSKQIGILKAMGIQDRDASLIFVFQGLMLGIIGAIFGIAIGIGLLFLFSIFVVNPDGTPIVPVYINPIFIIVSAIVAVISATLASLIPARTTSRLDPIEVIRNG